MFEVEPGLQNIYTKSRDVKTTRKQGTSHHEHTLLNTECRIEIVSYVIAKSLVAPCTISKV